MFLRPTALQGPAKSASEAKKQQLKYAAAKEARRLLGKVAGCALSVIHTLRCAALLCTSTCPKGKQ